MVKKLCANVGDLGLIPGSGRSLEKELATCSSIRAWEVPWEEEPGGMTVYGVEKELGMTEWLNSNSKHTCTYHFTVYLKPVQCRKTTMCFAQSLLLCPTLCDPKDCGLWTLWALRPYATPWLPTAPQSVEFSRQEYWSGLVCLPPGDLPDPEIEHVYPASPALQVDSLPLSHWGIPI